MGDLISRKKLLRHILEWQSANAGFETALEYEIIESCYRMVDNFPTAVELEEALEHLDAKADRLAREATRTYGRDRDTNGAECNGIEYYVAYIKSLWKG